MITCLFNWLQWCFSSQNSFRSHFHSILKNYFSFLFLFTKISLQSIKLDLISLPRWHHKSVPADELIVWVELILCTGLRSVINKYRALRGRQAATAAGCSCHSSPTSLLMEGPGCCHVVHTEWHLMIVLWLVSVRFDVTRDLRAPCAADYFQTSVT